MGTNLKAGMYLKLLKDITIYDEDFYPSPVPSGSVCKLESISVLLQDKPYVLILCSFSQGNLVFSLTPTKLRPDTFAGTFEVL